MGIDKCMIHSQTFHFPEKRWQLQCIATWNRLAHGPKPADFYPNCFSSCLLQNTNRKSYVVYLSNSVIVYDYEWLTFDGSFSCAKLAITRTVHWTRVCSIIVYICGQYVASISKTVDISVWYMAFCASWAVVMIGELLF